MKTIEIDFDVHKAIENERRGFDESPNIALRRLLGLPESSVGTAQPDSDERPFTQEGLSIPSGSPARMSYGRGSQVFDGVFRDGALEVQGKRYPTLSAAAIDLARTKDGRKTNLNGWDLWTVKLPNSARFEKMSVLRGRAQRGL